MKHRRLTSASPTALMRTLKKQGIKPLEQGRVIVATRRPHEREVRACIRELGLDWYVLFNRQDVMALPRGVDKASGLAAALAELGLSAGAVVGIGDAENDCSLLGDLRLRRSRSQCATGGESVPRDGYPWRSGARGSGDHPLPARRNLVSTTAEPPPTTGATGGRREAFPRAPVRCSTLTNKSGGACKRQDWGLLVALRKAGRFMVLTRFIRPWM